MARSQILTGSKAKLFINDSILGKVTSFDYIIHTPKNEIKGLDSVEPFEEATTYVSISGSITVYKKLSDGGGAGIGVTTPVANLAQSKYFSLTLVEIPTETVIFQADRCSLESESWRYVAKGVVMGSLQFKAISYKNEVVPKSV